MIEDGRPRVRIVPINQLKSPITGASCLNLSGAAFGCRFSPRFHFQPFGYDSYPQLVDTWRKKPVRKRESQRAHSRVLSKRAFAIIEDATDRLAENDFAWRAV